MKHAFILIFISLVATTFIIGCPGNNSPSSPSNNSNPPAPTATLTVTNTPCMVNGTPCTPTYTFTATPSSTPSNTPTVTSTFTITNTLTNSPTSTSTLTPSSTRTPSPTRTSTGTPTITSTPTVTLTPVTCNTAVTVGYLGNYDYTAQPNFLCFMETSLAQDSDVTAIQVNLQSPPSSMELGIYNDTGSINPNNLVYFTKLSAPVSGVNTVNIAPPYFSLPAGTYWLSAWLPNGAIYGYITGPSPTGSVFNAYPVPHDMAYYNPAPSFVTFPGNYSIQLLTCHP